MFQPDADFPCMRLLEANWQEIQAECLALPGQSFAPWVQREMYGTGWDVFGLIAWGHRIPTALRACPRTAAVLSQIPEVQTAGFSRLAAGAAITPHHGWVTNVYRLHLGLMVPPECALRVGQETRSWVAGKCFAFDDTREHEAWNRSDRDRYVLLLDVLRPGCRPSDDSAMPLDVWQMLAETLRTDGDR